jgi:hypothetical protein
MCPSHVPQNVIAYDDVASAEDAAKKRLNPSGVAVSNVVYGIEKASSGPTGVGVCLHRKEALTAATSFPKWRLWRKAHRESRAADISLCESETDGRLGDARRSAVRGKKGV